MKTSWRFAVFGMAAFLSSGCKSSAAESGGPSAAGEKTSIAVTPSAVAQASTPAATHPEPIAGAKIGVLAPDFTLSDLDGKRVSLSDSKGKLVVLEWFNPNCPFVKAAHGKGSLVGLAEKYKDRVVWLAINSSAPGKQGYEVADNRAKVLEWNLSHPILRDEDGKVGHAYGATNTPHMFIIGKDGNLAYAGAIDNSPDGEGLSPSEGKLVNYVAEALADLEAGKPVRTPQTKAYGCGVKYAK